ncbi:hypothetical protein A3A39_03720 [Candidatus Kaiserbacteria bacterium RIFCSPLOWO2_01_FULL_54_13]|uniref:Glycosyltransferase subfamily 4-like N-terminal domain-containing protein n=1 Tax=Candidatus Kaiserbacteria bacterium RIFCSPLOWO2_01_FULL_54_13 TaxID=1798512 RepID=A0A1F6F351_9BACT|nr:MAG: hypothetical protein A3A39_03720 [Candidatus Kaiserbacteria bacterium RIFCSPLOWO2_01_FULL_54_13]
MPKTRVLYLITKATYGGAQKYVFDLATNLPKDEFEPIVAYGTRGKLSADLAAAGITTRHLPSLGRDIAVISDIRSFFEILKTLRTTKPDVIHLNSSKAAALGALAARIAGVPKIIFTVHGWPFKELRNILAKLIIYKISWLTGLLSTAAIVVSKADEAIGKRMWFVGNKIRHIPIGINPPQFLSREEASSTLKISATTPRIVTIAELTPNKGVRYAIEAIAELKKRDSDASYTIIGDGEERTELVERTQKLGLADRVFFKGFVPDASKYLKAFDVFLLPSIKEGMPYVLLEAAASGLQIVTTNVVDPEFGERTESTHAIAPADAGAIAQALSETAAGTPVSPSTKNAHSLSEMVEKTTALYR